MDWLFQIISVRILSLAVLYVTSGNAIEWVLDKEYDCHSSHLWTMDLQKLDNAEVHTCTSKPTVQYQCDDLGLWRFFSGAQFAKGSVSARKPGTGEGSICPSMRAPYKSSSSSREVKLLCKSYVTWEDEESLTRAEELLDALWTLRTHRWRWIGHHGRIKCQRLWSHTKYLLNIEAPLGTAVRIRHIPQEYGCEPTVWAAGQCCCHWHRRFAGCSENQLKLAVRRESFLFTHRFMGEKTKDFTPSLHSLPHRYQAVSIIPFKLRVCRSRSSPMEGGREVKRFFSTFKIWWVRNNIGQEDQQSSVNSSFLWQTNLKIIVPAMKLVSQCPLEVKWACSHANPKPFG